MSLLALVAPRARPGVRAASPGAAARSAAAIRWPVELGLLVLLYATYLAARAAMGVHVGAAQHRGQKVLDLEAMAHLDVERPLNTFVAAVPALGLAFAYLYATLHYLVTPTVLVWLALRRQDGYRQARNALLVATAIGLLGYWLLPTAPPRLLGAGFSDTMATFSGVGWWGQAASAPRGMEALSNQYAALPSLHVGWALWVALMVSRQCRSPLLRRWVWAYPALMTVVVMATANHYLLDALAGIACALLGSWIASRVPVAARQFSGRRQGISNRLEVSHVRAAASSEHCEVRAAAPQSRVVRAELPGIAGIERLGLIELGVGLSRSVGAQAAQSPRPLGGRVQHGGEVCRVGAVDGEVGRGAARGVVHSFDGLAEPCSVGQVAVGLDRERDRNGQVRLVRR
jgi:hypothetical protein